ncbi:MAG: hypothetical protein LW809_03955 [Vampirovibrionales bacterium]|jgi:hypothetical protein|nr:hypothetical protein [Vampirovibrionales bacterium]
MTYSYNPTGNASNNFNDYRLPRVQGRPLPNVEQIDPIGLSQFRNVAPQTSRNGIVDISDTGLFRYNDALQKATLRSSGKSQSLFENNVNDLQMFGGSQQSDNGAIVQSNVQVLGQRGENGATNSVNIFGDVQDSYQSGTQNARNEVLARKVDTAIMDGDSGASNRFTGTFVNHLVMAGANTPQLEGARNDVIASEKVGQILTAAYNGGSSGLFNQVGSWEDRAVNATTQILAENMGQAYLEGQGNKNHLTINKSIKELGIGESANGNTNNITANEGIQRFGLLGKNNDNTVFSFSGLEASEAVLQGTKNKTLYGGNGKQTVRVGGENNTSIIATSDLTGREFKSDHDRKVYAAQQKDTLELGGKANKVQADLGVGNDDIFVHAGSKNKDNQFEVVGGAGQDAMTLEGSKRDWKALRNQDGSLTFTHRRFNQTVTVADVEDIRYSKKIESSKIGFNAPAEA